MSDHSVEDREKLKLAERRARLADRQAADTLRWIMSTPQGREWMHNLLAQCQIGTNAFSSDNTQITAFNCGQQNIGLQLWASLQAHSPDLYLLMMQEHTRKEIANATGRTTAELDGSENGHGRVEGSDLDELDAPAGYDDR